MTTLLSVNNYHYHRGGAETVFLEHNRLFERQGWQVVPFAMHHPRNLPTPWSEHFVDEIEFGDDYSLAEKLAGVPVSSIRGRHAQRLAAARRCGRTSATRTTSTTTSRHRYSDC